MCIEGKKGRQKNRQTDRQTDRQKDRNLRFGKIEVAVRLHDDRLLQCPITAYLAAR